jgi:hypothetical protein
LTIVSSSLSALAEESHIACRMSPRDCQAH